MGNYTMRSERHSKGLCKGKCNSMPSKDGTQAIHIGEKSSGPGIEPCGTPHDSVAQDDSEPKMLTQKDLSAR